MECLPTAYLVKLVNSRTKTPVLTVFVVGSNAVTADVPLGSYEVRYTWGESWYGYTYLFGDSGYYSKADETFNFKEVGDQVSGYRTTGSCTLQPESVVNDG